MAAATSASRNPTDRNADATVHISQLDDRVTDALLWELMVQAAPVRHVYIPRDRISGAHHGYGFCEFLTPRDAQYAAKVLNLVKLFAKSIRISQSTVDRRSQDVGANLYVGNLVEEVDEKLLHDAFSAFGPIIEAPYIMRDPVTKVSKKYGFVKYASFAHSDAAIAAMDGQYICNAPITVQYAFKKDAESHERHGSQAERIMAAKAAEARRSANLDTGLRTHTLFADRPAPPVSRAPMGMSLGALPSQTLGVSRAAPTRVTAPSGYPHSTQPYTGAVAQLPQWQQNAMVPQRNHSHQSAHAYGQQVTPAQPYVMPQLQQVPPTAQLGWSTNRHIVNLPGQVFRGPQAGPSQVYPDPRGGYATAHPRASNETHQTAMQNGMNGTPRLVPDESAPPPPRRDG